LAELKLALKRKIIMSTENKAIFLLPKKKKKKKTHQNVQSGKT